jgi:Flp pilus assembly pilin Flp
MTSEETSAQKSSGMPKWLLFVLVSLALAPVLAIVIITALIAVGSNLESSFSKVEEEMHQQQMQKLPSNHND